MLSLEEGTIASLAGWGRCWAKVTLCCKSERRSSFGSPHLLNGKWGRGGEEGRDCEFCIELTKFNCGRRKFGFFLKSTCARLFVRSECILPLVAGVIYF